LVGLVFQFIVPSYYSETAFKLLNILFHFDVISVNGHVAVVKMEIAKESQGRIVRKVKNICLFHVNCR
jgi:hypothetical protein